MLAALIGGQRDPKALAQLARGVMRRKITTLQEAFTGSCTEHHAFLLAKMLARADAIDTDLATLDATIEQLAVPFTAAVRQLAEIPGINATAAYAILAEIGTDMDRFPTAGHLVSWAKFPPGVKESAGKKKGKGTTGHGNRYLARVLGNAAASAGRTDTFQGERYRRIARRRGSKKAVVAVGRSMLVIIWHFARRPRHPLRRAGQRLLRHPDQPRTPQAQPHPPARSPRLQGHPRTCGGLTSAAISPGSAALRRVLPPAR
jgi:transposase